MDREISLESSWLLYSVDRSHWGSVYVEANEEVNVNSNTELDKVDNNNSESDQESLRHSPFIQS